MGRPSASSEGSHGTEETLELLVLGCLELGLERRGILGGAELRIRLGEREELTEGTGQHVLRLRLFAWARRRLGLSELAIAPVLGIIKVMMESKTLPASANDPHLSGSNPVSEFVSLGAGERVLALTSLATDGPVLPPELGPLEIRGR